MKMTLFALVFLLIAKDTSQLNDPYFMRGTAEVLCLGVGGLWILNHLSLTLIKRYWLIMAYVAALLISAAGSVTPGYVLLQALSLVAVLLFFAAYFESHQADQVAAVKTITNMTIVMYTLVAMMSLIVLFTHPAIAYGTVKNGWAGPEYRFRGLFPKAGMLASATGLTIGLAWFSRYPVLLKLPIISLSALCLLLTYSRTYWVALIIAGLANYWIYEQRFRKWILLIVTIGTLLWLGLNLLGIQTDFKNIKFLRIETISNLTGRISLWEEGLQAFYRRPLFGYGYTAGASGLNVISRSNVLSEVSIETSRNIGKTTLHSGYLQSLLDSGIVGTFFYLLMIVIAIQYCIKNSDKIQYRGLFYVFIFKGVCNFSESAIYSASVFDSVLFFAFAVFAFREKGRASPILEKASSPEEILASFNQRPRYKTIILK
jgi:O-antigen ligase